MGLSGENTSYLCLMKDTKILLLSIYHTGTQFCVEHLFGPLPNNRLSSGSYIRHKHLLDRHVEFIKKELSKQNRKKYSAIVVPLRHPARVKRSFEKRGWPIETYYEQWDNLIEVVAPLNPFYLHIDQEDDREFELAELQKLLPDYELPGDWPVVHRVTDSHEYPIDQVEDVPERYVEFYESTRKYK